MQNALLLAEAGARVTLVHHRRRFRARPSFLAEARRQPGITFRENTRVTRILVGGRVEGAGIAPVGEGAAEETLPCTAVFVYIGLEPNSDLVRGRLELEPDGRVRTDGWGRASVPGVFAAGDVCTPPARSSIATAVAQGMATAKAIALELEGAGFPEGGEGHGR